MLSIVVENERGKQLKLTGLENKFQIESVTGLNPPVANLASVENINDGEEFTHSRVSRRNIVINMCINGDVEANRLELYQYVQTGKYIKLYFETYTKYVWIDGRVETCEVDNFTNKTKVQISAICFDPWFKSVEEFVNTINTIQGNFYFPFYTVTPIPFSTYSKISVLNLINEGNRESGMTIEISAFGNVVNPIVYNRETREYIGVGSAEKPFTMIYGDKIVITTSINNKKIKLIRNAIETNIFNYLTKGSTFLNLDSGDNTFTYSADDGNEYIDIKFKHYSNYEGI